MNEMYTCIFVTFVMASSHVKCCTHINKCKQQKEEEMNIEDLDMVSNETDLYIVSSEIDHMMNLIASLLPKKQN